jgi:putative addiction module CopG family antidote
MASEKPTARRRLAHGWGETPSNPLSIPPLRERRAARASSPDRRSRLRNIERNNAARYGSRMTVTLPKKLEAFVQRKVRAGDFRNAGEAVREAVRQWSEQQNDWSQDGPELKSFLLEAVRGSHRPLQLQELEEMEQRVLAEKSRKCR